MYSLEVPHHDDSNEYHNINFYGKLAKKSRIYDQMHGFNKSSLKCLGKRLMRSDESVEYMISADTF